MDKTNLEHGSQAILNALFEYGHDGSNYVAIYKFTYGQEPIDFSDLPLETSCLLSVNGSKLKLSAALDYDKIIKLKGACVRLNSSYPLISIWLDQLPRKMALQISRELELHLALLGCHEILEIPWTVQ